jgi:hypothetical protein
VGPFVPADPALIGRVLASSGVERTPTPPESSYLGEILGTVGSYFVNALMAGAKRLHLSPDLLWWIAAGLAILLAFLIARLVFSRLRRRKPVRKSGEALAAALPPGVPRDAPGWRAELERRLAEGRIPEALEALWWWVARSLAGGEAEPDWTSRDLVARSRNEGLRELVRRLDAFTYGPRTPGIEELRGLLGRFEETLA